MGSFKGRQTFTRRPPRFYAREETVGQMGVVRIGWRRRREERVEVRADRGHALVVSEEVRAGGRRVLDVERAVDVVLGPVRGVGAVDGEPREAVDEPLVGQRSAVARAARIAIDDRQRQEAAPSSDRVLERSSRPGSEVSRHTEVARSAARHHGSLAWSCPGRANVLRMERPTSPHIAAPAVIAPNAGGVAGVLMSVADQPTAAAHRATAAAESPSRARRTSP